MYVLHSLEQHKPAGAAAGGRQNRHKIHKSNLLQIQQIVAGSLGMLEIDGVSGIVFCLMILDSATHSCKLT